MTVLTEIEKARVLPCGLLKAREAARYLGLSEKTLANWRVLGKGPKFVKRAGRAFYPLEALQSWVRDAVD